MRQPPEKIYLQWMGDDQDNLTEEGSTESASEITWCSDKQFDTDILYVRAFPSTCVYTGQETKAGDFIEKAREDGLL